MYQSRYLSEKRWFTPGMSPEEDGPGCVRRNSSRWLRTAARASLLGRAFSYAIRTNMSVSAAVAVQASSYSTWRRAMLSRPSQLGAGPRRGRRSASW